MEAQDLINKLLVPDPIKRINSTVEMMRSGSLSQCGDSDSKIRIQRFPGDGLEILKHPWFSGLDWEALERKELELPRYSPKYTNDPKAHVRFKNINDVIFEFRRRDESFLMENLDLASK